MAVSIKIFTAVCLLLCLQSTNARATHHLLATTEQSDIESPPPRIPTDEESLVPTGRYKRTVFRPLFDYRVREDEAAAIGTLQQQYEQDLRSYPLFDYRVREDEAQRQQHQQYGQDLRSYQQALALYGQSLRSYKQALAQYEQSVAHHQQPSNHHYPAY